MSNSPLDHVRRPDLPWRISTHTECGRLVADVSTCIDRDALLARLRDWGKQRTSLHTCMTCWNTAANYKTFEADPIQAMAREVHGARWGSKTTGTLTAELRALAALAVKYRDEFDAFVAGLDETASLEEARRQRQYRAYYGSSTPPPGA